MRNPPLKLISSVRPTREIQVLFQPNLPCRRVLKGPGDRMQRPRPRNGKLVALIVIA